MVRRTDKEDLLWGQLYPNLEEQEQRPFQKIHILVLERGLGQGPADSYSAGRETEAGLGCTWSQNGGVGPNPRFPAVATQSLPITSGEGSSPFCLPAFPPSPPSSRGTEKTNGEFWPQQGCWKLRGGAAALPPHPDMQSEREIWKVQEILAGREL